MPFVTTLHGRIDLPELDSCFERCFADALYVSISDAQRTPLPNAHWAGTVYHGIPENLVRPNFAPEGYLAFLGRICPEKGPETAIQLARAANLPLKIAAKVDKVDRVYFECVVKPLIDGKTVEYIGEIDEGQKARLSRQCRCTVVPDPLAGAVWARHGRGNGLRHASYRVRLLAPSQR